MFKRRPFDRKSGNLLCNRIANAFALVFHALLAGNTSPVRGQSAPHVILIVADDLNDYVWAEAERTQDLPNLSRLAEDGVQFRNAYVNSPLCCPSRASFMTGKTPAWTGVNSNAYVKEFRKHFPGRKVVTIPEHFKNNGYYTIGINKIYHNFQRRNFDNDFDYFQPDPLLRKGSWNAFFLQPEGNLTPTDRDMLAGLGYTWGRIPEAQETLTADYRAMNRALVTLNNYVQHPEAFDNRPLFLAIGMISTHVPHVASADLFPAPYLPNLLTATAVNYASAANPGGWPLPDFGPGGSDAVWNALPEAAKAMAEQNGPHQSTFDAFALANAHRTVFSAAELRLVRMANANMAYTASTRFFDEQIGRLLDGLDSLGLTDETIVVLLSDHGFSLGEHRHWAKNSLWETDNRVPLLIRDPSRPGGQVVTESISLIDVFPTLCGLSGLPLPIVSGDPDYLDGRDLSPLLDGASLSRPVISEIVLKGVPNLDCAVSRSVFTNAWHLLHIPWSASGTCDPDSLEYHKVLYDLQTDRLEWFNVAEDPENTSVMAYMDQLANIPDGAPLPAFYLNILADSEAYPAVDTLQLDALIRGENGDSIVLLPTGWDLQWQASIPGAGDSLLHFEGASWFLPLADLADSTLETPALRIDAWIENGTDDIIALDSRWVSLLWPENASARTAENNTLSQRQPCSTGQADQQNYFDIDGRPVDHPRPWQYYFDACGNKFLRTP